MASVESIIQKIAKIAEERAKIPAYERSVLNVLNAINIIGNIFWVTRYAKEPFNLVVEIVRALHSDGYVVFRNGRIELTEKGRQLLKEANYEAVIKTCRHCKGRVVEVSEILPKDVIDEFLKIQKGRPEPIQDFDQGYVAPEVTLARIAYMHYKGDLKGKDLILIGDDDLVSIAAGLTGWPRRIAVIDIDERLTKFISRVSEEYGLNIEILTMDLREPLPDNVRGKFDVFQTDPLETLPGLRLFIGRGIATLRGPRCAGYFHLTLIDASLDKWREVQRIILNEFNVVITDIIPDFSEYMDWGYFEQMHGWKKLPNELRVKPRYGWYTSTMFRIETLRGSKGLLEKIPPEVDIYLDEELASA